MGAVAIYDIMNLYDSLIFSQYEDLDVLDDIMRNKKSLKDIIDIPLGRTIQASLEVHGTKYTASISACSKRKSDFVNFQKRTTTQIKKQTHFEVFKFSDTILRLRKPGERENDYGISFGDQGVNHLDIFCGMRGLTLKNIDDSKYSKEDFEKTIEDIEMLANITFEPYLIGTNIPKDILYFIDPS